MKNQRREDARDATCCLTTGDSPGTQTTQHTGGTSTDEKAPVQTN